MHATSHIHCTYSCLYAFMFVYSCVRNIYKYIYMYVYIYIYIYIYMYAYIYLYIYIYIYTYTYIYIYIYICIHIYVYICIHTNVWGHLGLLLLQKLSTECWEPIVSCSKLWGATIKSQWGQHDVKSEWLSCLRLLLQTKSGICTASLYTTIKQSVCFSIQNVDVRRIMLSSKRPVCTLRIC